MAIKADKMEQSWLLPTDISEQTGQLPATVTRVNAVGAQSEGDLG